mgnify:CR=1 FL=1|tara:strand:- start:824 stop:1681 length:858 start_codon:yes stop_codon:yes gene_type:complete
MAITSAFKQFQRNFSPAQSLSDIGITAGVEGLPSRIETGLAAAPLQQKASRDTGGGAMMPGATNIMLTQMPFSTPQQQQQVTNPFAGAQFNFPVVQPAKTVGATYNITQAAPFDMAAYLKSLDTGTKVKNGKVKNGKVKNGKVKNGKVDTGKVDTGTDPFAASRLASQQAAAAAATKAQYGGTKYQVDRDDDDAAVEELVSKGVSKSEAKGITRKTNQEIRTGEKNPVGPALGAIAALQAKNIAASKAANESIAKAANKRNPANKYGVGTFRTTPGVGRGFSGGF